MTQSSRPNADHQANYPTSDAGPYSRDQWAEVFRTVFTGDQYATQGPYVRVLNELEVTNPAGVTIRVDTGAGICTGTDLFNSATVDFTPTTPTVGDRIDKVVMCLNNTNATYNTNLEFPTVLTDYDGTASIEPYSCRLVILTGVDGGAARVLVQTTNYYMVELARYTITMAPAISVGPTDYSEFAYFASTVGNRQMFVPAVIGWNDDTSTAVEIGGAAGGPQVPLSTTELVYVRGIFGIPADYKANMTVRVVFRISGAGNVRGRNESRSRACSQIYLTHYDDTGYLTEANCSAVADTTCCGFELDMASMTADDEVCDLIFYRDGGDAGDTAGVTYVYGWLVDYEATS